MSDQTIVIPDHPGGSPRVEITTNLPLAVTRWSYTDGDMVNPPTLRLEIREDAARPAPGEGAPE